MTAMTDGSPSGQQAGARQAQQGDQGQATVPALDLLGRLAARAVLGAAILPRPIGRFEDPQAPLADLAQFDESEQWARPAHMPAPPSAPQQAQPTSADPLPADTSSVQAAHGLAAGDAAGLAGLLPGPQPVSVPRPDTPMLRMGTEVATARMVALSVPGWPVQAPDLATARHTAQPPSGPEQAVAGPSPVAAAPALGAGDPWQLASTARLDAPAVVQRPDVAGGHTAPQPVHQAAAMAALGLSPMPAAPPPAPLQVEIHIDRIDVRALTSAASTPPPAPAMAPRAAPMSLDEHLAQRRGVRQ